jgi:SAM-dependent methyltransferase
MSTMGDAYSQTGRAWQGGPGLVYDRLAEELVACSPDSIAGRLALDLGAGTGAATRVLLARGAQVVAADAALGMLLAGEPRTAAVVADAEALPLRDRRFDLVVAAFSLNHLADPVVGLREAARVTRRGGVVLGSAYADDDAHVAKQAAEDAAARAGWSAPAWYPALRANAMTKLATVDLTTAAVEQAGCDVVLVEKRHVSFPELGARELVEWRLGMAQMAPFIATLSAADRATVVADAVRALRGAPPLVRSIVVFACRVPDRAA